MSGPPYLALSSPWEGIVSSSSLALRGCSYMCDWMRNSRALLNTWSGEKFPGQRGHTCFWIDLSYGELCLFLGTLKVLVLANVTLLGDPEWAWLFVMAMMPTPEDSSHAPPQLYPSLYLSSNLSKLVCAKGWTIVYISFLLTFSSGLIYQEDCSKGALREWEKNATRWPDYLKKHPPLERPIRKGSL